MRRSPIAVGFCILIVVCLVLIKQRGRHPAHAARQPATPAPALATAAAPRSPAESPRPLRDRPPAPPLKAPLEKPVEADFSDEDDAIVVSTQAPPQGAHGRIDPEVLETAVEAVVPALNRCYREALERDSTLRGDITIELTVSPKEGADHALIEDATVDAEEFQAPLFEQCLLQAVTALKLPRPTARQYISYPFTLDPGD
jgi:hypothetical protein